MKPLIVMICAVVSLLCCLELAHSAEWTVDQRSTYHVGAGAFISAMTDAALFAAAPEAPANTRVAFAFGMGCMAGAFKEFAMDGYPDYGDLAFTVLGSSVAFYTDTLLVQAYQREQEQGIVMTVRY